MTETVEAVALKFLQPVMPEEDLPTEVARHIKVGGGGGKWVEMRWWIIVEGSGRDSGEETGLVLEWIGKEIKRFVSERYVGGKNECVGETDGYEKIREEGGWGNRGNFEW